MQSKRKSACIILVLLFQNGAMLLGQIAISENCVSDEQNGILFLTSTTLRRRDAREICHYIYYT